MKFIYLTISVTTILTGTLIFLTNEIKQENQTEQQKMFSKTISISSIFVIVGGFLGLVTAFTLNKFTALLSGLSLTLSGFILLILQPFFGIIIGFLGIIALVFRRKLSYI
jgi:uncharacterized membrane protein